MKWKNLGLALVALVLPSWCLLASDSSNPTPQAPAWPAPPQPALAPDSGLRNAYLSDVPARPETDWRAAEANWILHQEQDGFGHVAPASCAESLPVPADGLAPLPYPPSDPADGWMPWAQPLEEPDEIGFGLLDESGDAVGDAPLVTYRVPPYRPVFAARLGWWFVEADGSPTKVAEYEGLESSAFVDLDGLFSDGVRTVNLSGSFLDNDTTQASLDYFGPRLAAEFDLQRYLHRLDHDPLTNMGDMQSGQETIREDLNVGEDYAIRVEDVKTSFEGRLNEHVKLRLNFRSLRRFGDRQANAMQHCFCEIRQNNCHVLSQRQEIDWLTVKIEPVIEAKYGPVRVEYSRPMRFLDQSDQIVTRRFFEFGPHFPTERNYAFVPENVTQIDRLKLGVNLAAETDFYARLSAGDTQNKFRDTHRKFQVYDLRLTNRSWDGLALTGYLTLNKQANQDPPFLLPEEQTALSVPNSAVPPYGIRHPIDYAMTTAGAEASWQPFQWSSWGRGLSLTAGCEQGSLDREYAEYFIEDSQAIVDQDHTLFTAGHVGASMRFSPRLDTRIRYKVRSEQDPLFGVNRYEGATNTNLPEDIHLVEIGGTWTPLTNLIASVTVGMENRVHDSEIADFDETSFPLNLTLWYAPTPDWSLSAGYGFYSNWIEQDILFPSDDPAVETWDRSRWDYGGRFRVLSLGAAYVWTPRITLSGGVDLVSSSNALEPLALWPDLPDFSAEIVDRTRVTAGVDWQLRDRISAYFRYRFEEYLDQSAAYNSGTAHMSLLGLSAVY
jgi:hypothetical protein